MISYTWDARKAARNLRIHGVSFSLAEKALRAGMLVPVEEQYRGGEWRIKILAMAGSVLMLMIVIGTGDEDEDSNEFEERKRDKSEDGSEERVFRIIHARKAKEQERALFFESRPQ